MAITVKQLEQQRDEWKDKYVSLDKKFDTVLGRLAASSWTPFLILVCAALLIAIGYVAGSKWG